MIGFCQGVVKNDTGVVICEIYDIIPEPHKVFKKEESNDIINNDATLLFGDIVEYEE